MFDISTVATKSKASTNNKQNNSEAALDSNANQVSSFKTPDYHKFVDALENQHTTAIESMMSAGFVPQYTQQLDPLNVAVKSGNMELVDVILKAFVPKQSLVRAFELAVNMGNDALATKIIIAGF